LIFSPIGQRLFAAKSGTSTQADVLNSSIDATPPPQSNGSGFVLPTGRILSTVIQTITLYNAPSFSAQPVGLLLAGQHWFVVGVDTTGNWVLVQITFSTSGWTIRRAFSIPGSLPTLAGTNGSHVASVFNVGNGRSFVYHVRPGDTLGALAVRYGTTVAILARDNKIVNPDLIFVGQVLVIP
jgi:hypothetical protein